MKYWNAQEILPEALVKELQNYVQGEYIYVPVVPEQQKHWGEVSGYRRELEQRNQKIKEEYRIGISLSDQSRQTDHRQILLNCLRSKISLHQRQPYAVLPFHLSVSDLF